MSLHILDVAENSIKAQAHKIEIKIDENREADTLVLEINDDGTGMDAEMAKKALDPFFSTKETRRIGLGLPLLAEAARAANGQFTLDSEPGKGTKVKATFQTSHIDMKPLGDMAQTLATLIMGHPNVDILYRHTCNHEFYSLDTTEVKDQLDGIPINSPEVIHFLKNHINEGIDNLRRQ